MTNEQYTKYREVMQKASYLRGKITDSKERVAYFSSLSETARTEKQEAFAKKQLIIWMEKLKNYKKQFNDLNMNNLEKSEPKTRIAYCPACSAEQSGVKTRISLEHTCDLREFDTPLSQKQKRDLMIKRRKDADNSL